MQMQIAKMDAKTRTMELHDPTELMTPTQMLIARLNTMTQVARTLEMDATTKMRE